MIALADRQLTAAGLRPVPPEEVRAGDVGVVCVPTPRGRFAHVGAVFTGRLWAVLGVTGLLAGPFRADAAWRP